ncbi:hypothetical protein C0995_009920, partial [Termitomyces sp. Mi166
IQADILEYAETLLIASMTPTALCRPPQPPLIPTILKNRSRTVSLNSLHGHEPNLPTQAEHHAPIPEAQEPKQRADELRVAQEGHEVVRAVGGAGTSGTERRSAVVVVVVGFGFEFKVKAVAWARRMSSDDDIGDGDTYLESADCEGETWRFRLLARLVGFDDDPNPESEWRSSTLVLALAPKPIKAKASLHLQLWQTDRR